MPNNSRHAGLLHAGYTLVSGSSSRRNQEWSQFPAANLIETRNVQLPALAPINDAVLTPDNERDLLHIYGRLLPALVGSMPAIITGAGLACC
jgi:hypothetical protein